MNKSLMLTCLHSTDPCGLTDAASTIYANPPLCELLGKTDSTVPSHAMTVFQAQEKQTRTQKSLLSVLNILPYGLEQIIQPYLFDFFPLFDEDGNCNGVFCYARPFPFFSLLECVDKKSPRLATVQQPNKTFTKKEWEIIFFLLNRLGKKEIAKKLNRSPRTIENKLYIIYKKLGVGYSSQVRNFCQLKGIDNYIPSKFLSTGSHVISVSARS